MPTQDSAGLFFAPTYRSVYFSVFNWNAARHTAITSTGISAIAIPSPAWLCSQSVSQCGCCDMGMTFQRHVHERKVSTVSEALTA